MNGKSEKILLFSGEELRELLQMKKEEALSLFEQKMEEKLDEKVDEILNKILESKKITELSIDENGILGNRVGNDLELELPYSGEKALFKARASQSKVGFPPVRMTDSYIIFTIIDYRDMYPEAVKNSFLDKIKLRLEYTNKDIKEFNENLEIELKEKAKIKKEEIIKGNESIEKSGIKMKK